MMNPYKNRSDAIWLQELGWFTAKPASDFKVGDIMVWNYGSWSEVASIRHKGKSTYIVQRTYKTICGDPEIKEWPEHRYLASRLIAYSAKLPKDHPKHAS